MARVKKSGGKAREAGKARKAQVRGSKGVARGGSGTEHRGNSVAAKRRQHETGAKGRATPPAASYRVRELNAQQKCGPGTSVERLFRVDETGATPRSHLVFLDRRHGWYCEHGVQCPAVGQARGMGAARTPQSGRTHNGGMRA